VDGKLRLFIVLCLWLIVNPLHAAQHDAIKSIQRVAEELGDASAQYVLGNMYAHGQSVKKDLQQAAFWYEKAALQNHIGAQTKLGILLLQRDGDKPSVYHQAFRWLSKAAAKQQDEAQYGLGEIYRRGLGLKNPKPSLARRWYHKAAHQGNVLAQFQLAGLFERGEGAVKNIKKAKHWYDKAAAQGHQSSLRWLEHYAEQSKQASLHPHIRQNLEWARQGDSLAQLRLGLAYRQGKQVDVDLQKALYWLKRAANKGHAEAQFQIAQFYLNGEVVRADNEEALRWLSLAAAGGHDQAQQLLRESQAQDVLLVDEQKRANEEPQTPDQQYRLAMRSMSGANKNFVTAVHWLRQAANAGHAPAQYQLANRYLSAEGVEKSVKRGVYWLQQAATQGVAAAKTALTQLEQAGYEDWIKAEEGDAQAQYRIAQILFSHKQNDAYSQALLWMERSARQAFLPAMLGLAEIYQHNEILPADPEKSLYWYEQAAQRGVADAQFQLGEMYSRGIGTRRDSALAARWYRQAAKQNHDLARMRLGGCLICE